MKVATLCLVLMFCGLNLAQQGDPAETSSCSPEMCDLVKEFAAMKERFQTVEAKLEKSENQTVMLQQQASYMVVFSTTLGTGNDVGPFATETTLQFLSVLTNIGSAYDNTTGIFTAPVPGVYYFTFFYHSGPSFKGKLMLYKNSQVVVVSEDEASSADNGGNAVLLHLQQGDKVSIHLAASAYVSGSDHHTTFSGYLL